MNENEKKKNKTQIFFWGSYIVLLGVSIPHSAYVFASFTDNSVIEVVFSYFIAAMIDVSIFIASYAIYQLDKAKQKHKLAKFGLYIWILSCVTFSWLANSTHAAHYENMAMLKDANGVPFFQFFIYIFSAFPLLLFIYPAVARIATRTYAEEGIVDTRSVEQIQEENAREIALLTAENEKKKAIAKIRGESTESVLDSGINGFIKGITKGVKNGFKEEREPLQEEIQTISVEEVIELAESPLLQEIEEKENGVPVGDEIIKLWDEVKKVNGKDVGFSTRKPFFRTPQNLLFMNISQAYQNEKNDNIFDEHITKELLNNIIDGHRLDARYIRYVETTSFNKPIIAKAILIHPDVQQQILKIAGIAMEEKPA